MAPGSLGQRVCRRVEHTIGELTGLLAIAQEGVHEAGGFRLHLAYGVTMSRWPIPQKKTEPEEDLARLVYVSVAKARQWMNVWKAVQPRMPYEVIASRLYMSISQVQRLVKAAWVMGVHMPARTRYEKRKHSGWVQIAAWV